MMEWMGIAADHGGFELKCSITAKLKAGGYTVLDFGAAKMTEGDDFPDYLVPLANAVAEGEVVRGIALCGSGVGACIVTNKIRGVRAALITDSFSAHQGVEDDDMNIVCIGGRITGDALAWEIIQMFLKAHFSAKERFLRRVAKISKLENETNFAKEQRK